MTTKSYKKDAKIKKIFLAFAVYVPGKALWHFAFGNIDARSIKKFPPF